MDREQVCHIVARDAVQDVYAGYARRRRKHHPGRARQFVQIRALPLITPADWNAKADAERDYAARFKAVKDLLLANAPKRPTFAQARAVLDRISSPPPPEVAS